MSHSPFVFFYKSPNKQFKMQVHFQKMSDYLLVYWFLFVRDKHVSSITKNEARIHFSNKIGHNLAPLTNVLTHIAYQYIKLCYLSQKQGVLGLSHSRDSGIYRLYPMIRLSWSDNQFNCWYSINKSVLLLFLSLPHLISDLTLLYANQ